MDDLTNGMCRRLGGQPVAMHQHRPFWRAAPATCNQSKAALAVSVLNRIIRTTGPVPSALPELNTGLGSLLDALASMFQRCWKHHSPELIQGERLSSPAAILC
jgi:hypothetical protein